MPSLQDLVIPLEKVDLKGKLRGLKEWNDGYEDLEAIAFSFVVEFKDNRPCWSMYADSDADKVSQCIIDLSHCVLILSP